MDKFISNEDTFLIAEEYLVQKVDINLERNKMIIMKGV